MRKSLFVQLVVLALTSFIFLGCGNKQNNSTPEGAFNEFIEVYGKLDLQKYIALVSQKSLTEQEISKETLEKSMTESFNDMKFKKFSLLEHQIIEIKQLSPEVVLIEANLKYKIENSEPQTQKASYVFIKENDQWKLSLNGYIKKESFKLSCGEKNSIKICAKDIYYFVNQVILLGTVENNSNLIHSFGFASRSQMKLDNGKGIIATDEYPRLGSSISKDILKGKSDIGFLFAIDSSLMSQNFQPSKFSINNVIPMNGSLPAGFDNEFSIDIKLSY